jgi:hypothetical protein
MTVNTNGRVKTWRITADDTDGILIDGFDDDEASVVSDSTGFDDRFFGTWGMVLLDITDDGANVDWLLLVIPIPLGASFGVSGTFAGTTGVPTYFRNSLNGPPSGVSVSHLTVTEGLAPGWLAPADTGYVGERANARLRRLCDEEGLRIDINTGNDDSEAMGPQRPEKLTVLLEDCATADLGILTESRQHLGFHYTARSARYNPSYSWDPGSGLIQPFAPEEDDQKFRNDVTVTRVEGSSHREVDQDSIDEDGRFTLPHTVNIESDLRLPAHAAWLLHQNTVPEVRLPNVTVEIAKDEDDLVESWLSTGPGDVIDTPSTLPEFPGDTISQVVEGYTEEISSTRWKVKANTSPASVWQIGVFDDDVAGRYDTAGCVLDATFEAGTDTSMDVETTLGPLWTEDAADCPFDVNVAGAQVTVTAISAPTGQVQTFTVSATIANGVEKTIAAGTDVRLWQPSIYGL